MHCIGSFLHYMKLFIDIFCTVLYNCRQRKKPVNTPGCNLKGKRSMFFRLCISPLPTVTRVGHIKYRHGWTESYCHDDNDLIFVVSGEFSYDFADGTKVSVRSGCSHIIPEGTRYTIRAEGDCDFYFVHFTSVKPLSACSEQTVSDELQKMKLSQTKSQNEDKYTDELPVDIFINDVVFLGDRAESLRYRISRCEEFRLGSSPLDRLRLQNSFFNLLLTLSSVSSEALTDSRHQPAALLKITGFIEDNYTMPITLSGLSEEFGFSKQYIMRLFHDHLGTTVTHYVNCVKLRKSQDLLRFTGLSIAEVAYSLGFSSSYYFCRLFKAAYTVPPTEYQKSCRKNRG